MTKPSDLKSYRVVDDAVQFVAGRRVPDDRIVRLTEAAARYDVDTGVLVDVEAEQTAAATTRAAKAPPVER